MAVDFGQDRQNSYNTLGQYRQPGQDYRGFLQTVGNNANVDPVLAREARALLQVSGNDGRIDDRFTSDPFSFEKADPNTGRISVQSSLTDSTPYGYGPVGLNRISGNFRNLFESGNMYGDNRNVLAATDGRAARSAAPSAEEMAYFSDQESLLRDQLRGLDRRLQQGITGLRDSYNQQRGRANEDRGRFLGEIQGRETEAMQGRQSGYENVNESARTAYNSLRQLLGMSGSANQTALKFAAPDAINRVASRQRGGVTENFAANMGKIDQSRQKGQTAYERMIEDLENEKKQKESGLRAGVTEESTRLNTALGDLNRQRAIARGGGYEQARAASQAQMDAIKNNNSALDRLFDRFRTPYTSVKPIDVQAPDVSKYSVDRANINARQQGASSNYDQFLRRQLRDEEEEERR